MNARQETGRSAEQGSSEDRGSLPKGDDEEALSKSKLGDEDDGGVAGQGGMRDPGKTSDAGKKPDKPS